MNVLAILGRLIVISLAFFVACMAALAVFAAGIWQAIDFGAHGPDADPVALFFNTVLIASFAIFFIGTLVAAPAFLAMIVAEIFSLRSWIYHVGAGAAATAIPLVLQETGPSQDGFSIMLHLAAGMTGGLVYWLLAGRRAGVATSAPPAT